jgi:hypothetical protein
MTNSKPREATHYEIISNLLLLFPLVDPLIFFGTPNKIMEIEWRQIRWPGHVA